MDQPTNQQALEAPALDLSTPDGVKARKEELMSNREWAAKAYTKGTTEAAELDRLQRLQVLGTAPPPATGPEAAKAKHDQLMHDREWGKRYLDNPKGPEGRELDRLQRIVVGMPETQREPTQREPGVPAEPSSYRFAEPLLAGSEDLATRFQTAAHAVGLTLGEFEAVHEQALRDAKANDGRSESEIDDQLDADLARIWGNRYDQMIDLINKFSADYERAHPGTIAFIRERGLDRNKSLLLFVGHKAMHKYGV